MKNLFFIAFFLSGILKAQLPDTDLWLAELDAKVPGKIKAASNITNRPGYDNQPSFSKNGSTIYFTSIHEDKQADIYACSVGSKKITQLTKTRQSEYSPNDSPFENNSMTAVAVLDDSSQVIELLDMKTYTVTDSDISRFDSVGYYTFLNADSLLYYKLTQPHTLRLRSASYSSDVLICEHPCRTFKKVNRYSFIYGVKDSVSTRYFLYDVRLQKANLYARINSVNEDMIWHPVHGLLISDKATILNYDVAQAKWNVLYDLTSFGIKKITRFCFDPKNKYLVVVNNL